MDLGAELAQRTDDVPPTPPTSEPPRRPRTRGECIDGPRPCPWVSCSEHLLHGRLARTANGIAAGQVEGQRMTDDDALAWLESTPHTCTLDVADAGGAALAEVADIFGVTRERIRQIETKAQDKVRPSARAKSLATYLEPDTDARDPDGDAARPSSRGKHTTARPVEDTQRTLTPPPATWEGPTHPDEVRDASETFWCAPLGAAMRVTLCCARQVAQVEGGNRLYAKLHPRYRGCAECAEGNALRARLDVVPGAIATRPDARRFLPVVQTQPAPAPAPAPIDWFGADDEPVAADIPTETETIPMNDREQSADVDAHNDSDGTTTPTADGPCCTVGPCKRPIAGVRADTIASLRRCCRPCRARGARLLREGAATAKNVIKVLGDTYDRTPAGRGTVSAVVLAAVEQAAPEQPAAAPPAPAAMALDRAPASAQGLVAKVRELRAAAARGAVAERLFALAERVGGVDVLEQLVAELEGL